jgi:hypothetical protein
MPNENTTAPGFFTRAQTFVAFASAVVGVVAAVQAFGSKSEADRSAKEASAFKQDLERQANVRAERESRAKFDSIAYEAAVKVLEIDRTKTPADLAEKRERAVMALIASTASEPMQTALFGVIGSGQSISASVRREAGQAAEILQDVGSLASDAPTKTVPQPEPAASATLPNTNSLRGFRVVLFYCQDSRNPDSTQAQRKLAETLASELRSSTPSAALKVAWETKELPEVLNSAAGYGIRTNQIRFNPLDNEKVSSLTLKAILEASSTAKSNRLAFDRRTVNQRTPSYLSVFLCGVGRAT